MASRNAGRVFDVDDPLAVGSSLKVAVVGSVFSVVATNSGGGPGGGGGATVGDAMGGSGGGGGGGRAVDKVE